MKMFNYQIQFQGQLLSPINQETATRRLASLYKTDRDIFNKLFDGGSYILKESSDKSEIIRYLDVYTKLGLVVEILECKPEVLDSCESIEEIKKGDAIVSEAAYDAAEIDQDLELIMADIKGHLK